MDSHKMTRHALTAVLALALSAPALRAQGAAPPPNAMPGSQPEPTLAFDREVFSYPAEGRRDPFRPLLSAQGGGGPLFNDLSLRGIIYSPDPRRSVALVQVGNTRTYRLRRGDVIGNARVLEIQPLRVRFGVENFGVIRNEVIELRRTESTEGEPVRAEDNEAPPADAPTLRNERREGGDDPEMIAPPTPKPADRQSNNGGRTSETGARP